MCRIMKQLTDTIKDIEYNHQTKLTDNEVERLKRLLCSYVCSGHCQSHYLSILQ